MKLGLLILLAVTSFVVSGSKLKRSSCSLDDLADCLSKPNSDDECENTKNQLACFSGDCTPSDEADMVTLFHSHITAEMSALQQTGRCMDAPEMGKRAACNTRKLAKCINGVSHGDPCIDFDNQLSCFRGDCHASAGGSVSDLYDSIVKGLSSLMKMGMCYKK